MRDASPGRPAPPLAPENRKTFITALFTDIVKYSSREDEQQIRTILDFQKAVEATLSGFTERFAAAVRGPGAAEGAVQTTLVATGDGILVVVDHARRDLPSRQAFAGELLAMALELLRQLAEKPYQVRISLSEGPAFRFTDVTGHTNYAGGTVNLAYRLMNLADGGQILASTAVRRLVKLTEERSEAGAAALRSWVEYRKIYIKHDVRITVHQVLDEPSANLDRGVPRNILRQLRNVDTHAKSWPLEADLLRDLGLAGSPHNHIRYIDNLFQHSDQLVVFLSGLGLDHHDFAQPIAALDYRCVAVTLFGFYPGDEGFPSLSLPAHVEVLRRFILRLLREVRPAKTVLAGFSVGGDLFAELLLKGRLSLREVQGLLTLDCNLGPHTCFISRRLARLREGDDLARFILETNREIIDQGEGFGAWLRLQKYFIDVFGKGAGSLRRFSDLAQQVYDRFQDETTTARLDALRQLSSQIGVRCLFSDNADNDIPTPVAGERFQALVLPGLNHFDLCRTAILRQHLQALME